MPTEGQPVVTTWHCFNCDSDWSYRLEVCPGCGAVRECIQKTKTDPIRYPTWEEERKPDDSVEVLQAEFAKRLPLKEKPMPPDLDQRLSAPWRARPVPGGRWEVMAANDRIVADNLEQDVAEAIAEEHNGAEVQRRRGWGVQLASNEGPMHGWLVKLPDDLFPLDSKLYPLANLRREAPAKALIAADEWLREKEGGK